MAYKLIITAHAENLLDNLIYHLLFQLKNEQAAIHLMNGLENVYHRLEHNPLQFPLCRDINFASKGYREAIVPEMDYIVIFDISNEVINILGIFHQLENYSNRL